MDPNIASLVLNDTLNTTLSQSYPIFLNATFSQSSQTTWKDYLPLFTVIVGIVIWGLTEWAKRSYDKYLQKVKEYTKLIDLIEALEERQNPGDPEHKTKFMRQLNKCWLVCPDDIINQIISYLKKLNDDRVSKEDREKMKNEIMITLRKDTLKIMPWDHIRPQTKLKDTDYQNLVKAMLRHSVLKLDVQLGDVVCKAEAEGGPIDNDDKAIPQQSNSISEN